MRFAGSCLAPVPIDAVLKVPCPSVLAEVWCIEPFFTGQKLRTSNQQALLPC
ncbi:MAG: hypothetical protein IPK95_13745 [Cellvibrionales bacterium]|nr:hypothetical protein [Cellvibrionales bacterium]